MWNLIRRIGKWLAQHELRSLHRMADVLPTEDQTEAAKKRLRHYEAHLREGSSWNYSKRIMELRLTTDERLQRVSQCVGAARRARRFDSTVELPTDLAARFERILGHTPSDMKGAVMGLRRCREQWKRIADDARRVRNPIFATQAFFRLSERSGLEIASFVIGALIALGAVQMLFFYQAAADHFVFAYWVWDDLIIQAINVAPIAIVVLVAAELAFRFLRWIGEKMGWIAPVLLVLHHPMFFAFLLFVPLTLSASYWGYIRGEAVWSDFKTTEGDQSATMMDDTVLTNVHLVGTTSRAAVFLRAPACRADRDHGTDDNGAPDNDASRGVCEKPGSLIQGKPPGYSQVACQVVCALPFAPCAPEQTTNRTYRVYTMDRDKIVCHARGDQCNGIRKESAAQELTKPATEETTVPTDVVINVRDDIATLFGNLDARLDGMREGIDKQSSEVAEHLDRHRQQIISGFQNATSNTIHDDRGTVRSSSDGELRNQD